MSIIHLSCCVIFHHTYLKECWHIIVSNCCIVLLPIKTYNFILNHPVTDIPSYRNCKNKVGIQLGVENTATCIYLSVLWGGGVLLSWTLWGWFTQKGTFSRLEVDKKVAGNALVEVNKKV